MLTWDEVGLTKKLINRGATRFLCLGCLGRHFGLTIGELEEMIERFRRQGCALFCASPPREEVVK